MTSRLKVAGASLITGLFVLPILFASSAFAVPLDPNRIIDDGIFDNSSSLNAAQIDAFLNSFPSSCISTARGFTAIDPVGYSPATSFVYGGHVSAGNVIAHAAQAYDLNPQVLLVTLQKEQSLVTGDAGCSVLRYSGAMGYGCPDSGTTHDYAGVDLYAIGGSVVSSVGGTCVNTAQKVGFTQQVIRGAWLLKFGEQRSKGNISWAVVRGSWDNSDDPQSCYGGPMTQGTWQVCPSGSTSYYDGYRTIDGQAVHMDTGATAALYWYTPHLSGAQSFVNIFTQWFGSTIASPLIKGSGPTIYVRGNDPNVAYGVPSGEVLAAYGLRPVDATNVGDSYIASLDTSKVLTTLFKKPNDGTIYLADSGRMFGIASGAYCTGWSLPCGDANQIATLPPKITDPIHVQSPLSDVMQAFGTAFIMQGGTKRPFLASSDLALSPWAGEAVSVINSPLNNGQPGGAPLLYANRFFKITSSQKIFYYSAGQYFTFSSFDNFKAWWDASPLSYDYYSTFNTSPPAAVTLNDFAQDGSSVFTVNGSYRLLLPSPKPVSPVSTATYPQIASLLQSKPVATVDSTKALRLSNGTMVTLQGANLWPIPTYTDFLLAFGPQNVISAPNSVLQAYDIGRFYIPSGRAVKPNSSTTGIYLYGANDGLWALNPDELRVTLPWGGSSVIAGPDASISSGTVSVFSSMLKIDGNYYAVQSNSSARPLPAAILSAQKDSFSMPLAGPVAGRLVVDGKGISFIHFDNGTIFKVSGAAIQPITSLNTYLALGGNDANTLQMPFKSLNAFNIGSPI